MVISKGQISSNRPIKGGAAGGRMHTKEPHTMWEAGRKGQKTYKIPTQPHHMLP